MTAFFDQDTADAEKFVIAWLTPLGSVDTRRRSGDPLPFRIVREVTNTEDSLHTISHPVVSVHTLAATQDEAASEAELTHRRMLYLAFEPHTDVAMPGGGSANVEDVEVVHGPIWVDYGNDQIFRKVARYELAFTYNIVQ